MPAQPPRAVLFYTLSELFPPPTLNGVSEDADGVGALTGRGAGGVGRGKQGAERGGVDPQPVPLFLRASSESADGPMPNRLPIPSEAGTCDHPIGPLADSRERQWDSGWFDRNEIA